MRCYRRSRGFLIRPSQNVLSGAACQAKACAGESANHVHFSNELRIASFRNRRRRRVRFIGTQLMKNNASSVDARPRSRQATDVIFPGKIQAACQHERAI
jgi:hypothetical protein